MQKVMYNVVNRPTKELDGVTQVINRLNGDESTDTVIGTISRARGSDVYGASLADGTIIDGAFTSRSQAGHAVQRADQADARAEKVAARETVAAELVAKRAAKAAAKADKVAATPAAPVSDDQAKKDVKNAKRRAKRLADKQAAADLGGEAA